MPVARGITGIGLIKVRAVGGRCGRGVLYDDTPATAAMTEASEVIDSFLDHQIIKHAEPEDIARVALFLASDEASFSAGRNLVVVDAPGPTAGRKVVRETVPSG
ncbi:SDR family oxidoreductase [Streptomyces sp. NPDC056165]|uniref:SDR family oxidoreductase n=1 Tax=Streptomyces sp. NPDC056165 TaxID=3345733 RepID=UPI0035DA2EEA